MPKASVLVIHNRYQQRGGEDAVVNAEVEMLRNAGHRVMLHVRDNLGISGQNALRQASLFFRTTWDRHTYLALRALIREKRPDIAHCHNLLPQLSPAAYYACRDENLPVVQTLHNYRLFCPAGTCFREGAPCRSCTPGLWQSVRRRCYRNSRLQTAAVALMLAAHRARGTWAHTVDGYLAPSRFCRDYFIDGGLPAAKVHLKQNFLARDPGSRTAPGSYAFFAGRFTAEKGVLEMLEVWRRLPHIPLLVAGDGPQFNQAFAMLERTGSRHIRLLGNLDPQQTLACIRQARFLVFPSRWHEPFGMVLIEAAASGVPALASRVGAIPELVLEGRTGMLFDPANFDELAEQADWAWSHAHELEAMGAQARQHYEQNFTAERGYDSLMNVYRAVLNQ